MAGNTNNPNVDIWKVISKHLKDVVQADQYFTGWVDGEENLNNFLREYEVASSTSFQLRSSAVRGSGKRYANEGTWISIILILCRAKIS